MHPDSPLSNRLRVNIVSWDGGGLGTDIDILTVILRRLGCEVSFKGRTHRRPKNKVMSLLETGRVLLRQRLARITRRPPYDLNLFIESVFPAFLPLGRTNGLFVHPEWLRDENLPLLSRLDWILCKTESARAFLAGVPTTLRLTAFTSPDKRRPGVNHASPLRCLHISGASKVKGTEAVVEAWSRNPQWPELTVVQRRRYSGDDVPSMPALPNVTYENEYLSDDELTALQNACSIHVLPSQAEGYGHILGEAMSVGAVVVTTDASPMNELIGPDRGVLVRVARSEPMHKSRRNFVDVGDLEAKLTSVFAMSAAARETLGQRARMWYEEEARRFETLLGQLLADVAASRAGGS